jgi:F420-dependent oxidoreductase-like protein
MLLGLNLRYVGPLAPTVADLPVLAREAERLGFSVVWTAEAFSSDAPSIAAWLLTQTSKIDVGTAAMQIPARTPAMTAMTAATLDLISGGRFRLGLGVSGPQLAEGWHGVPFGSPLRRTREYVDIVRLAIARERPLHYRGGHHQLPLPGGRGKALRLGMRPVRARIPIYLAAVGPRNIELAGQIADGWLAVFFAPDFADVQLAGIRRGHGGSDRGFDVVATVPVVADDDLAACRDVVRPYVAHYLGGMGSRERNFYVDLAERMGYGGSAGEVRDHYLSGRVRSAVAAIPDDFIDRTSLLGSVDRLAAGLRAYADAGVTTLSVLLLTYDLDEAIRTLRDVATAADKAGVGSVSCTT